MPIMQGTAFQNPVSSSIQAAWGRDEGVRCHACEPALSPPTPEHLAVTWRWRSVQGMSLLHSVSDRAVQVD